MTSPARVATLAEITPSAAALPAASRPAALIVPDTNEAGTHADAALVSSAADKAPSDKTTPRRTRRFASSARPRASRPATVPSGQPRCFAASRRVLPSRSQSTMGSRYFSGRQLSSSSKSGNQSSRAVSPCASDRAIACSFTRRRAAAPLAFQAVRRATPCSQSPRTARDFSEAALRMRTRKVAWKASSASAAFPRTRRQTPCTIGACRRTKAANAASSRAPTNWPSSWPSVCPSASWARNTWMSCAIAMFVRLLATYAPCGERGA